MEISGKTDPSEQVLIQKLDVIFPNKSVRINPNADLPFITTDLKKLDRLIKREYRKHLKSDRYLRLKQSYGKEFKVAASSYPEKLVRTLMEVDPGTAYRCLTRLAAQPGDHPDEGSFTLTSHQSSNLTPEQSIERIAQHFANISQEYDPLYVQLFPADMQG